MIRTDSSLSSLSNRSTILVLVAVAGVAMLFGVGAALASATFTDVPPDAEHAGAIQWAVENGITLGCGDGEFCPGDPTTRQQMVTFLQRLAEAGIVDAATVQGRDLEELLAEPGPQGPAGEPGPQGPALSLYAGEARLGLLVDAGRDPAFLNEDGLLERVYRAGGQSFVGPYNSVEVAFSGPDCTGQAYMLGDSVGGFANAQLGVPSSEPVGEIEGSPVFDVVVGERGGPAEGTVQSGAGFTAVFEGRNVLTCFNFDGPEPLVGPEWYDVVRLGDESAYRPVEGQLSVLVDD